MKRSNNRTKLHLSAWCLGLLSLRWRVDYCWTSILTSLVTIWNPESVVSVRITKVTNWVSHHWESRLGNRIQADRRRRVSTECNGGKSNGRSFQKGEAQLTTAYLAISRENRRRVMKVNSRKQGFYSDGTRFCFFVHYRRKRSQTIQSNIGKREGLN